MMAEEECQFLIGQTQVCLHLLLPADLREVREKTNSQEVRYQLLLISAVTYSEKGAVLELIDRTFIVAILI